MINMSDIDLIEDWLIGKALAGPALPEIFGELCDKLRAVGVRIDRAMLGFATLHPLINAETVLWQKEAGFRHREFLHSEAGSDDWMKSPMRALVEGGGTEMRIPLDSEEACDRFPICAELAAAGHTDYLLIATHFDLQSLAQQRGNTGILISWSTTNPEGFRDADVAAISYIQKRLAICARAALEAQVTRTIAHTYLGTWAGSRVLSGQIRHGDGEQIEAVIFYSDMRDSTGIAERLGPARYLAYLNSYFEAAAGPVLANGGEVLDFIGDAVLGVFPIQQTGLSEAARRAVQAAQEAQDRLAQFNASPASEPALKVGIALSVGEVMFGNIGVRDRLTFSVIGQSVHAAARVEALTKELGTSTLLTKEVADACGSQCRHVGTFTLGGFSSGHPLYSL